MFESLCHLPTGRPPPSIRRPPRASRRRAAPPPGRPPPGTIKPAPSPFFLFSLSGPLGIAAAEFLLAAPSTQRLPDRTQPPAAAPRPVLHPPKVSVQLPVVSATNRPFFLASSSVTNLDVSAKYTAHDELSRKVPLPLGAQLTDASI